MDIKTQGPDALRMMELIRAFEVRLPHYSEEGLIRGSTHPSVGMEAIAVGVSMALEPQDSIASNHRGHAHCLARGADPGRTLAEIFGRLDGYCGGRGGSMHIGVRELGILGTNGVVGAGIGLATGAALAAKIRGAKEVAIAYFGDGAANQGALLESFNLAAIWSLPVVFVCENNHFAQSSRLEQMVAQLQLSKRGEALGVPSYDIDGMDVAAVYEVASESIARARSGEGPSFIVADTYRYLGHMAGDTEIYRSRGEVDSLMIKDPITRLGRELVEAGHLSESRWAQLRDDVKSMIDAAEAFAKASEAPRAEDALLNVYETNE